MPVARRGFRYLSVSWLLAMLVAAGVGALPGRAHELFPQGIAAGDVTATSAVLWSRTHTSGSVRVEYGTDPVLVGARVTGPFTTGPETGYTLKVDLTGLEPGRRYAYRFATGEGPSPVGTFVTPPPPDRDQPVTLMWGADTAEEFRPFRIFQAMRARGADLFLFLGDTVYTDLGTFRATTLEEYRQKYQINRGDPLLREYLATVASWVIWDDHEVENNFDSEHIRLETGLRAFLEFWPIRTSSEDPKRLYRSFRWGRTAEFFILDTRQYRTPAFRLDGPEKTMLGRAQKRWLLDGLARSAAKVKVVVSTVPLRHHGADSWEGYAFERDEILRFIAGRRIANVVFLVGDTHYAALLRHPEGLYEAIASPLAASLARTARAEGRPETLWSTTGSFNYGWMRIAPEGIALEWRDDRDRLLYQRHLPVE
ncbi:MAG: alkaline phosphatase D family protein [Armatimonadota bacterium]|nr:alkaline phosphatase D family protein [Armatimonadota bacterium]MDR7475396.1 alkaline phosphatase D family protein [Armatimonadota bacterium]